jgi:hypothetical protein
VATHEDLGIVLVESTLVITDSGHVLDDDSVIRVLALLVQDSVGGDHVIDDVGLGNLLGAELLLGAEVHAVVVAKMVVAGNRRELDTGVDQKVNKGRLHLGLTRLEVVPSDERIVLLSELDGTRNKGVLRRAVDEGDTFQDTGNGKDCGRRDLLMAFRNRLEQVVGSVVDALDDVGEALRVGSPLYNDLVETIRGLELPMDMSAPSLIHHGSSLLDILADLLHVGIASLGARDEVVSTLLLVGGDKVWVVDAREGLDEGHLLADKRL